MSIPGSSSALFLAAAAGGGGGYQVERSLRFNSSDSAFCSRVFSSAGNRTTWTWSGWVKRCNLAAQQTIFDGFVDGGNRTQLMFESDNTFRVLNQVSSSVTTNLITTPVYRDASAWYHVLVAWDTSQGTSSNRVKIYFNGSQVTAFATSTYPGSSENSFIDGANTHSIGRTGAFAEAYLSAYLADIHFISGQALTPSSFTEVSATTGQLIPKKYTGTFGTNGFWLQFADNSNNTAATLGKDTSGNGNNWTPNNLSVTAGAGNDSLVDVPTNGAQTDTGVGGEVRGNYCTWNPLQNIGGTQTLVDGNLSNTGASSSCIGTIAIPPSGKWYVEVAVGAYGSARGKAGICDATGGKTVEFAGASSSGTIGIAVNRDAGEVKLYFNNVLQSTTLLSTAGYGTSELIFIKGFTSTQGPTVLNAGARPFAYTAPSGFKALCDTNLPAPVVAKSSDYFQTVLYTGTGSNLAVTGLNFSPDLIWTKARSAVDNHILVDQIRGVGNILLSNSTQAESAYSAFVSFDSNGFTKAAAESVNGRTYAAWCWDAGSSTVTNTQGSITGGSQVRANPSSGFSVVTWTGQSAAATIGHGLNAAPSLIICKARSNAQSWGVYHKDVGINNYLLLDSTGASTAYSGIWGSSAPTSTVFSVPGNVGLNNNNGWTYVGYCFAPVTGYSSFGSYTGNGSADGPFVYTGFRPRWVMIKRSDTADHWVLQDTVRDPYNIASQYLLANLSNAEGTSAIMDITSNGFKQRNTFTSNNASGGTYVWAAFAESPFQYARAR